MKSIGIIVLVASLIYAPGALAGDIAREVRTAGESPLIENGGYFELGVVASVGNQVLEQKNPEDNKSSGAGLGLTLNGEYRYNRLFFEAANGSVDGLNLGYTLWNNESWQVDFLAASMQGYFHTDNDINGSDTEEQRNNKLIERDTLFIGTGLRVTGYLDDYIIQYRLVADTFDNNGVESSLRFGKHWQYRNWNFHGIVGAKYVSAKAGQYYWGVKENDATDRFSAYTADDSVTLQTEFGMSYPINENWVFRSTARFTQFPDEKSNSPIIKDDYSTSLSLNITYVF